MPIPTLKNLYQAITRAIIARSTRITTSTTRMQSTHEHGQPKPQTASAAAHTMHPAGMSNEPTSQSTNKTHAKDDGNASIVPKKIQEKLPESVERAVPNFIHDTGDKK